MQRFSREGTAAMSKLKERIARRKAESEEFARAYEAARYDIEHTNDFMDAIGEHLAKLGLSKAELARLVDKNPSVVRRLFLDGANPTLETALAIAHALDLEVTVRPRERLGA